MKIRPFIFVISMFILLVVACSPVQTVTPVSPVVGPTNAPATPGSIPNQPTSQANPPTAAPVQPAQPPSGQNQPPSSGPVSLQVLSPQDGATVNVAQIEVSGVASPGAVVSVNDNVIVAGADGRFATTVSLDEGPNLIEVIASNNSGNQLSAEITVTYEP